MRILAIGLLLGFDNAIITAHFIVINDDISSRRGRWGIEAITVNWGVSDGAVGILKGGFGDDYPGTVRAIAELIIGVFVGYGFAQSCDKNV